MAGAGESGDVWNTTDEWPKVADSAQSRLLKFGLRSCQWQGVSVLTSIRSGEWNPLLTTRQSKPVSKPAAWLRFDVFDGHHFSVTGSDRLAGVGSVLFIRVGAEFDAHDRRA